MNIKKWIYEKFIYKNKLIANTLVGETDDRDFKVRASDYPEAYLINHDVPIRNQGSIGSCASHAAVRAVEIQMSLKDSFIEGSELYHYYMTRMFINKTFPDDKGQTIRDSMKCLQKHGVCPEMMWPYKTTKLNEIPGSFSDAIANLISRWARVGNYSRLTTVDQIKSKLAKNYPVEFGLKIDDNYMKLRSQTVWTPGGKYKGGHAQLITGYDDEYFYIENSWGTNWGKRGTYRAKIEDIMEKGFDFFIIDVQGRKTK